MLASIPPREQIVPIVGIIATNNGRTCQEHRFGSRGCSLDGALVRLLEAYTPEYPNGHSRALYHRGQQDSSEKVGGEWALVKTLPSSGDNLAGNTKGLSN